MWPNNSGSHGGNNSFRGGFNSGGGRGRSSGRNTGRGGRGSGGRGYDNRGQDNNAEPAAYNLCLFYVRSGNCRNGDNCRYVHNMCVVAFTIKAHEKPVKSIGVLSMPEGPKLITGSTDATVKVWNLQTEIPKEDISMPVPGPVEHLEVSGSVIMWSVEEPLNKDQPELPVGTVYLFNPNDMSTLPIKRSDELPYTHACGPIRSFTVAVAGGVTYVITSGGDGSIRTWQHDAATGKFNPLALLEGHIRSVTCLLLHESYLWSGSVDYSIRVWEVGTGKCLGVLSSSNNGNGHREAVSCLELIPAVAPNTEAYVASGGGEGDVKLWKTNGEFVHTCSHASFVTALRLFQDSFGGIQVLLIGLLDGSIVVRSCSSMNILFTLENAICRTLAVWSITNLGQSCFATGGDDGNLIVWRIEQALQDKQ